MSGPDVRALLGIPFSAEQMAAITAPLEPAVIVAGAGTGKTTVMAARVVWLVGSGLVRPAEILGLTFTRKAAHELGERIRAALTQAGVAGEEADGEPTALTYDAFAGRLVAEHGPRLGVERDLRLVSDAELYAMADRVVAARRPACREIASLTPSTVVERVVALSSEMLANGVGVDDVISVGEAFAAELDATPLRAGRPYKDVREARRVLTARRELVGFVADLWEAKRRAGVVEFADRTALAARLATEMPGVGRQLRSEFAAVLLDEYQDTSAAQTRMLAGLFSGPAGGKGRGFPVTAVGDPLQAIYEWRGAAVGTMAAFPATFPRADGRAAAGLTLRTNRRSGEDILAVANRVSAPLRAAGGPTCPAALVGPDGNPAGVVVATSDLTWDEELDRIVATVLAEHDTGGVAWRDIAVLARRNADLGRIHHALDHAGVPAELVGLGGLLALTENQQIIAELRLLIDVADNPAAVTLLAGPRWQLGPRDLDLLRRRAVDLAGEGAEPCLLEAVAEPGTVPLSDAARRRCGELTAELARLRGELGRPVAELVGRIVAESGVAEELRARDGETGAGQVEELLEAVEEYAAGRPGVTVSGLLAWFDAELSAGRGLERAVPVQADAVSLMTVHRAKGLEWEVVLLPALVGGVFPADPKPADWTRAAHELPFELRGDADGLPELTGTDPAGFATMRGELKDLAADGERRLGYVAVSRARRRLYAFTHTWRSGEVRPRGISPFWGAAATVAGAEPPAPPEDVNPYADAPVRVTWPIRPDPARAARVGELAEAVRGAGAVLAAGGTPPEPVDADVAALARGWNEQADRLLARRDRVTAGPTVSEPGRLSVSEIISGIRDPAAFRRALARPMPTEPSRRATLGTRFHAWVEERFGAQGTLGFDEDEAALPVRPDSEAPADVRMARELEELCRAFEAGRFAERQPLDLEVPFTLSLGGHLVRGRIDAVYREPAGPYDLLVVDWKTYRGGHADPYQLALYRLAAAQIHDVAPERVRAAFYYVRDDRVEVIDELPGSAEVGRQVAGLWGARPTGRQAIGDRRRGAADRTGS